METIQDFEDMLFLLNKHEAKYLIIGGWKRIVDNYGAVETNWIDIDSLIRAKQKIDNPRYKEDVRVLLEVKQLKRKT